MTYEESAKRLIANYKKWRRINGQAYRYAERLALQEAAGKHRVSSNWIIGQIRLSGIVDDNGKPSRPNSSYAPILARELIAAHPEIARYVERRTAIYDNLMKFVKIDASKGCETEMVENKCIPNDLPPLPPRGFDGQEPPTMSTKEAAWLLSCSVKHVRDLCVRGDIKAVHVGKLWLIDRAQVYELLGVEGRNVYGRCSEDTGGAK